MSTAIRATGGGDQGNRAGNSLPDDRGRRAGDLRSDGRGHIGTELRRRSRELSANGRGGCVNEQRGSGHRATSIQLALLSLLTLRCARSGARRRAQERHGCGYWNRRRAGARLRRRAALVTRGLAEMTRLGTALGAEPGTFAGLAGLGDLVLTCHRITRPKSAVGGGMGKGKKLEEVLKDRETVAEGVVTARVPASWPPGEVWKCQLSSTVNRVLFEGQSARSAIAALMAERAPSGGGSMKAKEPVQDSFRSADDLHVDGYSNRTCFAIGEVESSVHSAKNRSGNRVYQRREIKLVMLVKQLLYTENTRSDAPRRGSGRIQEERRAPHGSARGSRIAAVESMGE